eukprot:6190324-Pleurochrysis_carterae.AAC.1
MIKSLHPSPGFSRKKVSPCAAKKNDATFHNSRPSPLPPSCSLSLALFLILSLACTRVLRLLDVGVGFDEREAHHVGLVVVVVPPAAQLRPPLAHVRRRNLCSTRARGYVRARA